jgi:hypothetical protein
VSVIHKLITSIWNKKELPISGRSLLLYQFTRRMIKLTVIFIVVYQCYQLHTKFYQISILHGQVHTYIKSLGTINVDFDITDQLLIRFSAFARHWKRSGCSKIIHQLFVYFKKASD